MYFKIITLTNYKNNFATNIDGLRSFLQSDIFKDRKPLSEIEQATILAFFKHFISEQNYGYVLAYMVNNAVPLLFGEQSHPDIGFLFLDALSRIRKNIFIAPNKKGKLASYLADYILNPEKLERVFLKDSPDNKKIKISFIVKVLKLEGPFDRILFSRLGPDVVLSDMEDIFEVLYRAGHLCRFDRDFEEKSFPISSLAASWHWLYNKFLDKLDSIFNITKEALDKGHGRIDFSNFFSLIEINDYYHFLHSKNLASNLEKFAFFAIKSNKPQEALAKILAIFNYVIDNNFIVQNPSLFFSAFLPVIVRLEKAIPNLEESFIAQKLTEIKAVVDGAEETKLNVFNRTYHQLFLEAVSQNFSRFSNEEQQEIIDLLITAVEKNVECYKDLALIQLDGILAYYQEHNETGKGKALVRQILTRDNQSSFNSLILVIIRLYPNNISIAYQDD